jgi:hypothetical protein
LCHKTELNASVNNKNSTLPASATPAGVAWALLLSFIAGLLFLRTQNPFEDLVRSSLFLIVLTAAAVFLIDSGIYRVQHRPSTGMAMAYWQPNIRRALIKLVGLIGSLAFVGCLYWVFPEYHGSFYDPYYELLRLILPAWLILALPYIYYVDARMPYPKDMYWVMGRIFLLEWEGIDWRKVWNHLLGWIVKGFFLPLMFVYMCRSLDVFLKYDFSQLTAFRFYYDFLFQFLFFIDVGLVSMGYLMSLRLFDTHIRSTEPTMLGWVVALICYQPFLSVINQQYLAYETGHPWGEWLWGSPMLYGVWGCMILMLIGIYVWSTVIFGARFSNLTHRGIITNGPYRWSRHPAYWSKNLSWWMISVPFLVHGSWLEMIRHCALLLMLNGIYYLRAKTEEAHLSNDPDYVQYSNWVAQHGLLRKISDGLAGKRP